MSGSRLVAVSCLVASFVACGGPEAAPKAPPAPAAPKDPPLLSRIAQACARATACIQAPDIARFRDPTACVDWWLSEPDQAEPLRKCLSEAGTCEQVSACMHGGGDARAASFCAQRAGVVSACDGDRLVSCGEDEAHETTVVDCAKIGASCREVKSSGGLVVRACWSGQKCPAGAPDLRCDGPDRLVSCRDGAFERVACPPGTACVEHEDASGEAVASCELPGRGRCGARGARYCEGDRLVECDRNGHGKVTVTDCVGYGLRCEGVGPRAGCYVPSNVECDRARLARCEAGSLVFCAAGRLAKVACDGLGLGTCNAGAKGAMAACAPRASTSSSAVGSTPPAK